MMHCLTVADHILQVTRFSSLSENPSAARSTLDHDVHILHTDNDTDAFVDNGERESAASINGNDDVIAVPEAPPAERTLILTNVPEDVELVLINDYFFSCGDVEMCERQDGDTIVR